MDNQITQFQLLGQYLIQAFLRIGAGDVPLNTALTSGGVWDQQNQRFTTKPTENVLDGVVYDRSDLPADAVTSTQYDYWQYNRYYTEGEGHRLLGRRGGELVS